MPLVRWGEVAIYTLQGSRVSGIATRSRGASQVMVWRETADAGRTDPPRAHDQEAVVLVLSGSGTAREGDREHRFGAGDVLIFPGGTVHQVIPTPGAACELVIAMPAGTRLFTADGEEMEAPWAE